MKKISVVVISLVILFIILGVLVIGFFTSSNFQQLANRPVLEVPLTLNNIDHTKAPSIEANKLPAFIYDLTDHKFDSIISQATNVGNLVKATIFHSVYANEKINATVSVDPESRKLTIKPEDVINFRPGMYKLSLTLRTLEGDVNIDQDFSWGVIAVNTNKSIYNLGEMAKIGIGVLNDRGQTQCMTGLDRIDDLSMTVTDPQGNVINLSIKDKTITDSGHCGPATITNEADFQAKYKTTTTGIYQMTVTTVVRGEKREITDYFKVDPNVAFDVERTSFPTRIYPPAPYPATFTVTAKKDYQGTITDTVPNFFAIDHVSDNGKVEIGKDFTRIIWDVSLEANIAKNFTYFIQFPKISPEFYLIGPIQIGSFKEARQWQIASDAINSSPGVFTAEDNSGPNTWYRAWTGTAWNPNPPTNPTSMSATPQDSRWFSEKSSPLTGEKLVVVEDNNNSTGATANVLYVFRWNTATSLWVMDIAKTLSRTAVADTRYADVAYEQLSGDAMVVYCDQNSATPNQVRYITRTAAGVWSVSGVIPAGTLAGTLAGTATSPKAWVRLVPQPNSNSILLTYVNNNNYVGAMVWDGAHSTWTNEIIDNAGTQTPQHVTEVASSAWETNSGTPMIMWGNASTGITYRRLINNAWTAESTTGLTGFNTNAYWVNLAADDSSNKLALGTSTSGNNTVNCYFAVWNGTSWTQDAAGIGCRYQTANNDSVINNRPINVVWEHGTSRAIWVYNTRAAPTMLNYKTWSANVFGADTSMGSTAQTNPISIELYSDPNTTGIILMYSMGTQAGTSIAVFDREWDGNTSTWTGAPANPLFGNIQNGYEHTEAWGFGFDNNLELQAAYRFFGTQDIVNPTNPLTAADTPYTFTYGQPDFHLRLVLYYSDLLAQSGRNYDLQFVDPGTGSCANPSGGNPSAWTNVGTSGTLITYFNNPSVNNAANISYRLGTDPVYGTGLTMVAENYEEQNPFTNAQAAVVGGNNTIWDFALKDNTTTGRSSQSFCFRVIRDNGTLIKIDTGEYPQITTFSQSDVIIRGGTQIRQGTTLR